MIQSFAVMAGGVALSQAGSGMWEGTPKDLPSGIQELTKLYIQVSSKEGLEDFDPLCTGFRFRLDFASSWKTVRFPAKAGQAPRPDTSSAGAGVSKEGEEGRLLCRGTEESWRKRCRGSPPKNQTPGCRFLSLLTPAPGSCKGRAGTTEAPRQDLMPRTRRRSSLRSFRASLP